MHSTRFLTYKSQISGGHDLHMMYKNMNGQLEVMWREKEKPDTPATS